jgi:hypothetical protein
MEQNTELENPLREEIELLSERVNRVKGEYC